MTTKIAISLPDELAEQAKQAVAEGRAASVSAYIAALLEQRAADEKWVQMLAEMDAEYGEPTAEHYAWAERVLGIA